MVMVILKQVQIPVNKKALKLMTAIWARQKLRGMRNGSIRHIIPVAVWLSGIFIPRLGRLTEADRALQ